MNDVFVPVMRDSSPIHLLYGSYGSGKTVFLSDLFIDKAISNKYFRGYFGRKIYEDVRESVFQTIVDRIKERNLQPYFSYSEKPNGTMTIVCRETGNMMLPFGCSNPTSIKSIKDPTDFLCDEFDKFTFVDFGLLYSRLRTTKAELHFYAAFNTEKVFVTHWIRKVLFEGIYASVCQRIHCNYTDNFFIDRESYLKKLLLIANGEPSILAAIANGAWGMVRTGTEFLKQFDETKHTGEFNYAHEQGAVWVSLDKNVVPYVTQTIWQYSAKRIIQVHEILSRPPKQNNAVKAANQFCNWLDIMKHKDIIFVCGDPTAKARSATDENGASFFDKYIETCRARGYKVVNKVLKASPLVTLSGLFVNTLFENEIYAHQIRINRDCIDSINDYIISKEDAEGKMLKEETTDKESGQRYQVNGHLTDTLRYLIITILEKEFRDFEAWRSNGLKSQMGYFG